MTFLKKTMWEYAFACVGVVPCGGNNDLNGQRKATLKHNKAWLLADSGAELASADPRSVHSSFRFSFCSQVEVESFNMSYSASAAAATFLMVNLDYESQVKELKWRRIQSPEKSLSPVANTLIRFSYDEILSATHNFSKGNLYVWACVCGYSVEWIEFDSFVWDCDLLFCYGQRECWGEVPWAVFLEEELGFGGLLLLLKGWIRKTRSVSRRFAENWWLLVLCITLMLFLLWGFVLTQRRVCFWCTSMCQGEA